MKVLLCSGRFHMGGIEKYVQDLAMQLQQRGYDVRILVFFYTVPDAIAPLKKAGIQVSALNGKNGRDPLMLLKFWKALRDFRPDIVHMNYLPLLAAPILRLSSAVVLYTVHQMDYIKAFSTMYKNTINGVIAVSNAVKEYLTSKNFLPKSEWRVIHNGIERKPGRKTAEYRPGEPIRLVMVSRLAQDKQPHLAVEILNLLKTNSPRSYRLTFIGSPDKDDAEYIAGINARVAELGLEASVEFAGMQKDVFPWLQSAQGLLMLSRKEAFGYNVLEALSVGVPVFSFNVEGGLQDLHQDGVSGVMTPGSDAEELARRIDEVFAENLWEGLSRGALKNAEKFSVEKMTEKTMGFYREILNKKNSR